MSAGQRRPGEPQCAQAGLSPVSPAQLSSARPGVVLNKLHKTFCDPGLPVSPRVHNVMLVTIPALCWIFSTVSAYHSVDTFGTLQHASCLVHHNVSGATPPWPCAE